MAKIIAPNKEYTGVSASIPFCKGEAHTDDPHLIKWFKAHGYKVEEEIDESSKDTLEVEGTEELVEEIPKPSKKVAKKAGE